MLSQCFHLISWPVNKKKDTHISPIVWGGLMERLCMQLQGPRQFFSFAIFHAAEFCSAKPEGSLCLLVKYADRAYCYLGSHGSIAGSTT